MPFLIGAPKTHEKTRNHETRCELLFNMWKKRAKTKIRIRIECENLISSKILLKMKGVQDFSLVPSNLRGFSGKYLILFGCAKMGTAKNKKHNLQKLIYFEHWKHFSPKHKKVSIIKVSIILSVINHISYVAGLWVWTCLEQDGIIMNRQQN